MKPLIESLSSNSLRTCRLHLFERSLIAMGAGLMASVLTSMNADTSMEQFLFDFSAAPPETEWQVVNDDVMGGVSSSRFDWLSEGSARFSGVISLQNNGGFASVRSLPVDEKLAGFDSFVLCVRGDGKRYKFVARTTSDFGAHSYQAAFSTKSGEWQEVHLPFDAFVPTYRGRIVSSAPPLAPARIRSAGFLISDKQSGAFQLEVRWGKASKANATRVSSDSGSDDASVGN